MRKNFTIMEMIIVIAIVSIVSSIVFPIFTYVKNNAQKTVCISNERQLASAILMYAQDNDEMLPRWNAAYVTYPTGKDVPEMWWKYAIQPYVKGGGFISTSLTTHQHSNETGVWRCPMSDRFLDGQEWLPGEPPPTKPSTASYGLNMFLAYRFFVPSSSQYSSHYYTVFPLSALRSPSSTILLGESGMSGRLGSPLQQHWKWENETYNDIYVRNWERPSVHYMGSNYIFCDGHARFIKSEKAYPDDIINQKKATLNYFAATETDYQILDKT